VALTDQLDATVVVKLAVIEGKPSDQEYALSGLIHSKFFLPIHEEINAILKSKIHLREGKETPDRFVKYFKHCATEKAYWSLRDLGILYPGQPGFASVV
jgi:hypothetical protein